MRIALFHNLTSGGAKRTAFEAVQQLAARHEIDVFTLSCANHAFGDLRPLVNAHHVFPFAPSPLFRSPFGRINQLSRLVDLVRLRSVERRIAEEIRAGSYDVVYVQPCQFENAPSLLTFLEQIPTIYYCHEPLRRLYEPMPVRPYARKDAPHRAILDRIDPLPWLYANMQKRADARNAHHATTIVVNSRFSQNNVLQSYGLTAQLSYHGVDIHKFRPLQCQRRPFIFSVGSLTPLKGFDFLIESVAKMPPSARIPFYIASNFQNQPERAYLEQLSSNRNVDCHFLGAISDDELVTLYNQASVVAYAPIREPFGLVPLEAMACGTPVVAVAEGGIKESVIHEQTGLLTERDPAQFAAALGQVLGDTSAANRYGQQGRQHVIEHWSWEQAAARIEEKLLSVAAMHSDNLIEAGSIQPATG